MLTDVWLIFLLLSLNTMADSTRCILFAVILLLLVVGDGSCGYEHVHSSCDHPRLLTANEIVCTSSSEETPLMAYEKAFDGIATEDWGTEEGTTWASRGEGVGAWVKAYFKQPHQVKKIELVQRANEAERNRGVELTFSEGQIRRSLTLRSEVRTNSLTVTILDVFGTISNGWEEVKIYVC